MNYRQSFNSRDFTEKYFSLNLTNFIFFSKLITRKNNFYMILLIEWSILGLCPLAVGLPHEGDRRSGSSKIEVEAIQSQG